MYEIVEGEVKNVAVKSLGDEAELQTKRGGC